MEKIIDLPDRIKQMLGHYGLSVNELAVKIGGSRMKFYNLVNGKAKPDFDTTEAILKNFPEISAEWFMRGAGPMLKDAIISSDQAEAILAENKAIKALYRAELMGKPKGTILCPDVDRETRKHQFRDTMKSLRGKRTSKSISVRIPGVKVPSLPDLFEK